MAENMIRLQEELNNIPLADEDAQGMVVLRSSIVLFNNVISLSNMSFICR